jgi:hypothetical protein
MAFDRLLGLLTSIESILSQGAWDDCEPSVQEGALDAFSGFSDAYRTASTIKPKERSAHVVALLEELESAAIEVLRALQRDAGIPAELKQRFADAMGNVRRENEAPRGEK